jgi:hypothetical protein
MFRFNCVKSSLIGCMLAAALVLHGAAPVFAQGNQGEGSATGDDGGRPFAVGVMVAGGMDDKLSAIGRVFAGGMMVFGRLAPELHVSLDGYARTSGDQGSQALSLSIADIGVRYAFQDERFTGAFGTFGLGYGIFVGGSNQISLADDTETCANFPGNDCSFDVDKLMTGRLGFGWGFAMGEGMTMAARLDLTGWWYSVALEQSAGNPTHDEVKKPHIALSVLLGLELLRWY